MEFSKKKLKLVDQLLILTRVSSSVATSINFPLGENFAKETPVTFSSMSVFRQPPEAVSQILQDPSWLADTIKEPSLLKCTEVTGKVWARITWFDLPVFTSQTRTVSSKEPETMRFDWGLKLTQNTKFVWPRRVLTHSAERASQMRRVRSSEAEQIYVESEDQAKSLIPSEWPTSWDTFVRVSDDHMIRVLSREEEANSFPLFENLTQEMAREWDVRTVFSRYGR